MDLHTIGIPEMQPPRYSVKQRLGLVSDGRHYWQNIVDSIAKQIEKELKASYSSTNALELLISVLV